MKTTIIANLICLAGIASIFAGLWQVFAPLAWIVGGAFVCVLGVMQNKKQNPPPSPKPRGKRRRRPETFEQVVGPIQY